MVSPTRPFKCPFMSVVKQGGEHRFPNLARVCCWDRDRSRTKLIVCLQNAILVSECSEDMCPVKNGSNIYLGDNGVKDLVIICDHIHFSHRNEWTQDCLWSPEGAGPWPKTMWHWYRKWMVSETSCFLLTVSANRKLISHSSCKISSSIKHVCTCFKGTVSGL